MKHLTKRRLAFVVAAAMGIAGCADDGKDGADGAPGEPGPGPNPPVTESADITHITMISHAIEEGQVRYEFEVTNEDGVLVNGLGKAEAKFAEKTDRGVVLNRDGNVGGYTDSTKEGSSLTAIGDGHYEFIAAMPAVTAASEGIVWLRVGGDSETEIARSQPMVVDKPEMIHTSTTETCYSCHVDYGTSSMKHPSYTAINVEGEVDFVAGCLVCHNNVSRAEENGGYATNTLQKIGHINHQKFEKDFAVTNCYTCHAEPVINTSIAGNGCSDCHSSDSAASGIVMAMNDFDAREFHAKSENVGLAARQDSRSQHSTMLSDIYTPDSGVTYCTDLSLYQGESMLDIETLSADGTLSYTGGYMHGYNNKSIIGRETNSYATSYKGDGTKTMCYAASNFGINAPQIMASSRVTFAHGDDPSYDGVTFTSYSPVFAIADGKVTDYDRRHAVTSDSCSACHNEETNYHKNGGYSEGGYDCVACHNNGQNRMSSRHISLEGSEFASEQERINAGYIFNAAYGGEGWQATSGPGFGPMVHAMHWGASQTIVGSDDSGYLYNSSAELNAINCVSCHAEGIDLYAIPNQYMLAKTLAITEEGNPDTNNMASPITANCYACHDSASALNHMEQNGGEINAKVDEVPVWYEAVPQESCATCHAEGKSFGIDKFHVFER
ncbi:multiheme c-type cytochrome [Shewanella japonica]|uniref:Outer membrane cytochrome MtrC/MtrF-like domain-containing protein n=1 Tax=Shewanella japonica TaxID=93973 RepID=A0ABM6JQ40_9GAMM|nr:hypothetical protein [Shewanella japonica]ARD23953.1 hypothetical protein SJ2017_3710 [Shewanella japonica]